MSGGDAKDDGAPPSNWQSVFYGPAWTWDAHRAQYYLHNFLPQQPQLNVHEPQVQEALIEVARFWLERGVDGFRLDAINFLMHDPHLRDNPPAPAAREKTRPFDFQEHLHNQSHVDIGGFLERLRALCDRYGDRFLMAEVPGERALEEMRLYTEGGVRAHAAYSFEFLYASRLTGDTARAALSRPHGEPAWGFSNHDAPRAVSRWAEGRDGAAYAKLLLLLLGCLRGRVFLYQGEELGLPQGVVPRERLVDPEAIMNWPLTLGRDGARTPMPWRSGPPHAGFSRGEPWLPLDPRHAALSVEAQAADPGSTLVFARRLLAARRGLPALRTGELRLHDSPGDLLSFERGEGDHRLLCLFNLGHGEVQTRMGSKAWRVVFQTPGATPDDAIPEYLAPCCGVIATPA